MSGARLVNRTERLAAIEQLLFHSSIGLRVVEIAEACDVDRRTIYRDLAMLCDAGIPIEQRDGRFFVDRDRYTATTRLTFDEAIALFLAARTAARFQDQHNPHMVSALQKVGQALPRSIEAHLQRVVDRESETTVDLGYLRALEMIARAWSERYRITLYDDTARDARPMARDFATYFIEPNDDGVLCVVGLDGTTQRIRAFNLNRVRRVRLTSSTYKIPDQLEIDQLLLEDWGELENDEAYIDVILLFEPDAVTFLNDRQWPSRHYRDRVERLDNGSVKATLYVRDWQELLPWIRSWGAQVEVLEPPLLRRQCALEAAQLDARYRPVARTR